MKHIIDIPDDVRWIQYIQQTHNAQNLIVESVCDLTPYTEPDRKAIEDAQEEAWNLARKIMLCIADDGLTLYELRDCFGGDKYFTDVLRDYSYQETKARYDAWKKKKDEIRVGDEVTFYIGPNDEMKAVALDQTGIEGEWSLFTENGCVEEHAEDFIRKTGRHFDEIEKLMKKMKKEEE